MTTAGPVAEQPSVPTKSGTGRLRDSGSRSDAPVSPKDNAGGFGDVMAKLQKTDGKPADDPSATDTAPKDELQNAITEELKSGSDAAAVSDALVDADFVGPSEPDTAVGSISAAVASDIAAMLAVASAQPNRANHATPALNPRSTAADPAAAVQAALDQQAAAAETQLPSSADTTAIVSEAMDATQFIDGADPTFARAGAQVAVLNGNKLELTGNARESSSPDLDADLSADAKLVSTLSYEPAPNERLRANVLRQETHFAPVAAPGFVTKEAGLPADAAKQGTGLEAVNSEASDVVSIDAMTNLIDTLAAGNSSPAQQITDRIAAEVPAGTLVTDRNAPVDQASTKAPLKVLQIQLQPMDLGTVTVYMEMKNEQLTLHVEAERAATAELLRSDQDTLSKLLRSSGYTVDGASIRISDGDRTVTASQSGQQGAQTNLQSSPQSHSGGSEQQRHQQRGGGGSNAGETGAQSSRNEVNETIANRAGVGVYI